MKTVIELPQEEFNELKLGQQRILRALEEMKMVTPPEFILYTEFMRKTNIGKTKFFELVDKGRINTRKVGRKVYVPASEVTRFFNGEVQ